MKKKWSELNTEEKNAWLDKAQDIIYPDLRLGYKQITAMKNSIAKGLYGAYLLIEEGDGGKNGDSETIPSMLDDNKYTHFSIKPVRY